MEERLDWTDQILRRIRAEFLEMPGMRLTFSQAQRLWGLDEQTCAQALELLTADRFLSRRPDGT
jgi:Fic family protein